MSIRKVAPIAGAMWVMNGVKLWWRDLRGLGFFGALLGVLGILPNLLAGAGGAASAGIVGVIQFVSLIASALVVLALFYAAREVDEGRSATPAQLARTLQDSRTGRLLAGVLLPQLIAMVLCMLLLGWIIGFEEFERLVKSLQDLQTNAKAMTPEALATLPIGRFMLWLVLALGVVVLIGLLTFTMLPDMIFGDTGFGSALRRSVQACLANLPAMAMFTIAMTVLGTGLLALMGSLSLILIPILGQLGAGLAINALFVSILIPISTNALYLGWKEMLGAGESVISPPTDRVAM
jgi:hypothetical protein